MQSRSRPAAAATPGATSASLATAFADVPIPAVLPASAPPSRRS